jgi:hypothetical protein
MGLSHLCREKDNRLVVISYDEEAHEQMAEISHEALIREWKKLRDRVAADPQFLQWNDAGGTALAALDLD